MTERAYPPGMTPDGVVISGIKLWRCGDYAIVEVEIGGRWVEVIRERADGAFSHIVEPLGIQAALDAAGTMQKLGH